MKARHGPKGKLFMYQSIPSLTTPSPGGPTPGEFFERVNSPPGTGKVQNPDPRDRKIVLKSHPGAIIFTESSKNITKHETEIKKNSIELLMYVEILKQ